jgi:hypothetical protein
MSLVSINDVLKITTRVEKIHPYKVVGDRDSYSPYNEGWSDCVSLIEHYLEQLPSVEPERKKGRWEVQPSTGEDRPFIWWKCSECGHVIFSETERDRKEFHAFCGRCGADMRGER